MCYACKNCGRCGKFKPDSPYYRAPAAIPCFACGGEVDPETGTCVICGAVAFAPPGRSEGGEARRRKVDRGENEG